MREVLVTAPLARSFAIPAAVVASLLLAAGPRSALAKDATLKAHPPETRANISPTFEITPSVDWRLFNWKEFGANGVEQLSESGSLLVLGVDPKVAFGPAKRWFVESGAHFYLGKVDYDGAQQNGVPVKSKTGYFGLELAPTAGYVFSLGPRLRLTPTAGLGFEFWDRDVGDGDQRGYDEKYTVYSMRGGLRAAYPVNRDIGFHSKAELKVPVSISESVGLGRRGVGQPLDVSLSPGISPAILIEGGSTIYGVDVALYFETWTLKRSDLDKGFLQPDSTRKLFGIRVGHAFAL